MSDAHCVGLVPALTTLGAGPWICAIGQEKPGGWWNSTLAAPLVALAGVVLTLVWNAAQQRRVDRLNREHVERAARATAYAEIWRLWRETRHAWRFVQEDDKFSNGMIWVPVFRTVFPSRDNLTRIAPLSAREVAAITSVYYIYQEAMVFLKASALWVLPLMSWSPTVNTSGVRRRCLWMRTPSSLFYKLDQKRDVGRREEVLEVAVDSR